MDDVHRVVRNRVYADRTPRTSAPQPRARSISLEPMSPLRGRPGMPLSHPRNRTQARLCATTALREAFKGPSHARPSAATASSALLIV